MAELLRFSGCELRSAYLLLNREPTNSNFKAGEYAISVQLQPKNDVEFTLKAGLTRKSSVLKRFDSWALGAATGAGAPGAGYDGTGHQDGAAYYIVKSSALIKGDPKRPLNCGNWSGAEHVLESNLGLKDWLIRSANGVNDAVGGFSVDKHTFLAEITIQFDAAGGYTYNFPAGTDFITASGRDKIDEILSVTITHDDVKKELKNVVTLPTGSKFGVVLSDTPSGKGDISPDTKTRLDLLQLQQSIQNIPQGTFR